MVQRANGKTAASIIQEQRKVLGGTLEEIAESVGVTLSLVSLWERDLQPIPLYRASDLENALALQKGTLAARRASEILSEAAGEPVQVKVKIGNNGWVK